MRTEPIPTFEEKQKKGLVVFMFPSASFLALFARGVLHWKMFPQIKWTWCEINSAVQKYAHFMTALDIYSRH